MKYRNALFLVFGIILLDQVLKFYVKTQFYYGEEVMLMGSWARLHFLENEGMAFGMKLGEGSIGKLLLTVFRLIAVCFGFYLLKQIIRKGYNRGAVICCSLILAGALGNLIDSIFYGLMFSASPMLYHAVNPDTMVLAKVVPLGQGYGSIFQGKVVDMFYFPMIDIVMPQWVPIIGGKPFSFFEPVFNLADASISVGVLTLIFFQQRLLGKQSTAKGRDNGAQERVGVPTSL